MRTLNYESQPTGKAADFPGFLLAYFILAFTALLFASPASAQNPATTISVDANANRLAINPDVYGLDFGSTSDLQTLNAPINRQGGNATSAYNWQLNATNLAADWYFESYPDASATPGESSDTFVSLTKAGGAQAMLTMPVVGYLANLGPNRTLIPSFSVAKYGAQTAVDPFDSDAGNGVSAATGNPITGNNPLDSCIPETLAIQQGWLNHLIGTWGTAANGGVQYYLMDNEPSIWSSTHRDIHPIGESDSEIYNDIISYGGAIRTTDPSAKIIAGEEWGWDGYFFSGLDSQTSNSDYAAHGNMYHMPWLLQSLHTYQINTGIKPLDVFSVHYYPQSGEYGTDDSAAMQLTRNRSTRSLWDPAYVDQSWIGGTGINGGIVDLIPMIKSWVAAYYPGLQTAITEYDWGDEANLNGATTQADIEGIFGRQGLDMAARWTVPANPSPTYLAMQIYRNYDGSKSTFGDTSVSCSVVNPDSLSAFASQRTSDGALTVMVINKVTGSTPVTINLANFSTTGTSQVWQISSKTQTTITQAANVPVANNAISTTVPGQSITLFVVPSGTQLAAPTAPTGLAATVGSGAVTLTWTTGGGATAYQVWRSLVSGGSYTKVGTVTNPAPATFTDTGLTNGTTYYYVVTGSNSAGASPNSAEVAATPIVPPTFTSSAAASPNPVLQGVTTTVTATVNCTGNTLTNGTIKVTALDPNGVSAATQSFTAQSLTSGQQKQYTLSFAPSLVGTYTLTVGVYSASGQPWNLNTTAGTITVNSNLAFTSSASLSVNPVVVGGASTITTSVTETGAGSLTNGIVELQLFNSGGTAVTTTFWTGQNFNSNQNQQYTYAWTAPATAGTYAVMVGVFNSTWSTNYSWNSTAASAVVINKPNPPAAPAGLTANGGNASVALSWGASTGAVSYNVYRSTTAAGEGSTPVATGITGTSYSNSGLTNGTTYYFKVAAVNTGGTSPQSNEASATPIALPPAPTGLTATAGSGSVALSWGASAGAASYNVYRSTTAGGEGSTPVASGVSGTIYSNSGLTNGTPYFFTVAAVNPSGTSAQSNEATATPIAPPAAPSGLTASAGNASVALSWSASTGASTYNLYRSTTSGGEGTSPVATAISGTTYSNSGLTNGTLYFFKVAAVNASGTSGQSNEATATPVAPPPVPAGLAATAGNASVALSWGASSGATSYNIYRSTTAGSEGSTPIASGVSGTTYSNFSLTNGTTYFYKVAAVNASGTSGQSTEVNATPLATPAAPSGLSATRFSQQVRLTWTGSTGATSYNVYQSTSPGGEGSAPVASGINAVTYMVTGLTNGTKYYFTVAAVNASGVSPMSNEVSSTPAQSLPPTPTNLAAAPGPLSVTLTWTATTQTNSYDIYRSTVSGGEGSTPLVTGVVAPGYMDNGLVAGTTYYYKVVAVNTAGLSGKSAEASAVPTPAGPPTKPAGLAAVAGNSSVALSWGASSGAATYNVYRSTTAGAEGGTPIATGISGTTFTSLGLTNGTAYFFTVAAVNAAGTSTQSNEATATPIAAPAAPTGLAAVAGNASVDLSWGASSGATTYNVYRSTTAGAEGGTPIATGISGTTFSSLGLTNGTAYFFTVAAVNASGTSAQSNEATATPIAAPAAPAGLAAVAGNASVALSWGASSGAATYNVYRSTTAGAEGGTPIATGISGTTFTSLGLTNGTAYFFTVAAVNAAGTSAQSNEATAMPSGGTLPTAPTGLTATRYSQQVRLTWTASPGASDYDIYLSTSSGGEGNTPAYTGITPSTFMVTGLTNGTKYYFTVVAVNASGNSPMSGEVSSTPLQSLPPTPSNLSATPGSLSVSLTWTATLQTSYYNIYRSTLSGNEGGTPIASGILPSTFTDTGLTAGTTYFYKVAAVNTAGLSAKSAEVSAAPTP